MMDGLKIILEIQEKDLNMLRLIELKKKRKEERGRIVSLRKDLEEQLFRKDNEVLELKKEIKIAEGDIREAAEKIKKLDGQQGSIKKVDEFNALTKEMSDCERSRVHLEAKVAELGEQLANEEEVFESIRDSLDSTKTSSEALEKEIMDAVGVINKEGRGLKVQREKLAAKANTDVLWVYERLLGNKRDRVVVPIENRTCSGCHIVLTAQHENLVRKGERLVFCEHCSRIHYWQEAGASVGGDDETPTAPKRRRRTKAAS